MCGWTWASAGLVGLGGRHLHRAVDPSAWTGPALLGGGGCRGFLSQKGVRGTPRGVWPRAGQDELEAGDRGPRGGQGGGVGRDPGALATVVGLGQCPCGPGRPLLPETSPGRWTWGWARGASWHPRLCGRRRVLTRCGRGRVGRERGQLTAQAAASASETADRAASRPPGIVALSPLPGQRAPLAPATVLGPRLRGARSGLAPAAPPHSAPVGPEHGDTRHVASSVASCLQRAPPRPPRSALLTVTATGHCPWGVPCWQGAGLHPCASGAHGVARCAVSRYGLRADQLAHLCRLVCPSPLPEADRGHCLCREGSRHGGGAWWDLRHLIAGG